MKSAVVWFGVISMVGAFVPLPTQTKPSRPWRLVVAGDANGYLSPCGCTYPMSGGVRRRAAVVRKGQDAAQTVYIDPGRLGGEVGRQSEMKAETSAQIDATLNAAAIHLTEQDLALGSGSVSSVIRLSEGRMVSASIPEGAIDGLKRYSVRGPMLISGVAAREEAITRDLATGAPALPARDAARNVVEDAKTANKRAVVMFTGNRDEAKKLATEVPGIDVLVYRSIGTPPLQPLQVGKSQLITLGDQGKHVVSLDLSGGKFGNYRVFHLGPDIVDDPIASRLYKTYLRRVTSANLLDAVPREPSEAHAGTPKCGSCHENALKVWNRSGHSHALASLAKEGHDRDPDCVSCHVVGLTHEGGYRDMLKTPGLANVGCESCHGPGAKHADAPKQFRMPKTTEATCTSCHRPEQSPNFNFLTYWRKVSH